MKKQTPVKEVIIYKLTDMDDIGNEGPLEVAVGTMKKIMEFMKERLAMWIEEIDEDYEDEDDKELKKIDLKTDKGLNAFLTRGNYELEEITRVSRKDL